MTTKLTPDHFKNLPQPKILKPVKFRCLNCNKEYGSITGAIGCPCQNKVKWNPPSNTKSRIGAQKRWMELLAQDKHQPEPTFKAHTDKKRGER